MQGRYRTDAFGYWRAIAIEQDCVEAHLLRPEIVIVQIVADVQHPLRRRPELLDSLKEDAGMRLGLTKVGRVDDHAEPIFQTELGQLRAQQGIVIAHYAKCQTSLSAIARAPIPRQDKQSS